MESMVWLGGIALDKSRDSSCLVTERKENVTIGTAMLFYSEVERHGSSVYLFVFVFSEIIRVVISEDEQCIGTVCN